MVQQELGIAQILFPMFLSNPVNAANAPQLQDLFPHSATAVTSSELFADSHVVVETISGVITPPHPPNTPQPADIVIAKTTITVVLPPNLPPLINIDTSPNLIEAANPNPGVPVSVAAVIKSDLDGVALYDTNALTADHWDNLGNGIFAKLGSYGAVALNTTGLTAALLLTAAWTDRSADLGSGIFSKVVTLHDINGNPVSETVEINLSANTLTYALDNVKADPLNVSDIVADHFTIPVVDDGGAHNSAIATFTIEGRNDAAVMSADIVHLTETNSAADIGTHGALTISDVDSPATFQAQTDTVGQYGKFSIDTHGVWTYTASSAHNEFAGGVTYTDTFDVQSADGTHTSVTVDILGTNDPAVLSADVVHLTETNSAADISTHGALTISDVDSPATFKPQTDTVGLYGKFSIGADGLWTYTASSAHNEFAGGVTYTDAFDVQSADGTHTSVTVDILGTDESPTAVNDTYSTTLGHTLHVPAPGILGNDIDVDHDLLSALLQNTTIDGALTVNTDGSFDYKPYMPGETTFTYKATDGTTTSDPATVTIDVGEGPDTFDFSSSTTNTVYVAPAGINNIIGGTGSDSLIGNNNGDILIGGAGNDGIVGGSGNDVLIGGAGTDALTGRGGDDTFVFRPGFGHDLVTDFSVGDAIHHDTLDLRGLGFTSIIDVLNHTDLGTSAVIHAGPDDITLLSVSKDMLALHAATILV